MDVRKNLDPREVPAKLPVVVVSLLAKLPVKLPVVVVSLLAKLPVKLPVVVASLLASPANVNMVISKHLLEKHQVECVIVKNQGVTAKLPAKLPAKLVVAAKLPAKHLVLVASPFASPVVVAKHLAPLKTVNTE